MVANKVFGLLEGTPQQSVFTPNSDTPYSGLPLDVAELTCTSSRRVRYRQLLWTLVAARHSFGGVAGFVGILIFAESA